MISYDLEGRNGFAELPELLQPYVQTYVGIDVSPTLVRKAFMEGFINMLTYILGELTMTSNNQRTWLKLYRVMEQAIFANIVKL